VAINPDNICAPTACATNLATPTLPPVPFLGDAQCTSLYQNTRADDDVWFTIVPDTNTTVVIDVNPTGNMAYFDPVVGLYEGTCNNLVQVHCADNAASGMAETLHFVPVPNTTYYVRVFSYGMHAAHQGPFDMCVKYVANFGVDVTHLLQNIVVYPNPNAGHFTVDLGKHQSAISYHITDMLGREILRGEARDCSQFDLHTSLATGVYTLTIQSASWHAVRRVVVK
jgi:hypothetical protein